MQLPRPHLKRQVVRSGPRRPNLHRLPSLQVPLLRLARDREAGHMTCMFDDAGGFCCFSTGAQAPVVADDTASAASAAFVCA